MFIRKSNRGYYGSDGSQHSGRGEYLMLFSWNNYKVLDALKEVCPNCQYRKVTLTLLRNKFTAYFHSDSETFNAWSNAYEACYQHREIGIPGPRYLNGREKLWAVVRTVAMHQFGHIGGKRLTVSGEIGSDGLPDDLQDLPEKCRAKLIEVPEAIAEAFWSDKGWNDVGQSRHVLRQWALSTFKAKAVK